MSGTLHADAVARLTDWVAPSADQEELRDLYLQHLATHPDAPYRECRPDHLTTSLLVVSADHRRVLLTLHPKAGMWLQTGGHCELGDTTLVAGAAREGLEESGIAGLWVDPVPVLLSRHAVPFCGRSAGSTEVPHHLDVQFVAVAPADAQATASDESDDLRWFAVDELPDLTDDDLRRLVSAGTRRLRGTPGPVGSAGTR